MISLLCGLGNDCQALLAPLQLSRDVHATLALAAIALVTDADFIDAHYHLSLCNVPVADMAGSNAPDLDYIGIRVRIGFNPTLHLRLHYAGSGNQMLTDPRETLSNIHT